MALALTAGLPRARAAAPSAATMNSCVERPRSPRRGDTSCPIVISASRRRPSSPGCTVPGRSPPSRSCRRSWPGSTPSIRGSTRTSRWPGSPPLAAARRATAALRRGGTLPPLFGIPVSIKDLTATKGIRTTWGSKIFEHHIPSEDALVVERLKAAGAIVVGKTNTPEFGAGGNTFNAVFGATRNPWNLALTCGGSSGGAAVALATGMGPLAQGSDLGGSLRMPAAFCGVVGFRTTPGLVPGLPAGAGLGHARGDGTDGAHGCRHGADAVGHGGAGRPRPALLRRGHARVSGGGAPALDRGAGAWPGRRTWTGSSRWKRRSPGLPRARRTCSGRSARACATACPSFAELHEVVLGTRGLFMVALHADRLAEWRGGDAEGPGLEHRAGPRAHRARHRAAPRSFEPRLWHRVRRFMESVDLLVLPTVALKPFPVEQPYPTELDGKPVGGLHRSGPSSPTRSR